MDVGANLAEFWERTQRRMQKVSLGEMSGIRRGMGLSPSPEKNESFA